MAQLWGGRFTKETDQLVYNFNASISFDKRFYAQDIRGSIAHVMMLARQGILTDIEKELSRGWKASWMTWSRANSSYQTNMRTFTVLWRLP
jgi:hypothetical protein